MKHFKYRRIPLIIAALSFGASLTTVPLSLARAQTINQVSESELAAITLPSGALQFADKDVPHEISDALQTMVQAGGPDVKRGGTEVFGWGGKGYKKSRAGEYKTKIADALKRAGWEYTEGEKLEGAQDATMVSALKTTPTRKALIGFWAPTDAALILAWTEMLPAKTTAPSPVPASPAPNSNLPAPNGNTGIVPPKLPISTDTPPNAVIFDIGDNQKFVNVMKGASLPLPSFPTLAPKPKMVRGYVKDWTGKPLANAQLGVRSTAIGGVYSGADGKTDDKGYYEILIPFGVAEFYNAGYAIDYGEGRAALGLHPADGNNDAFASPQGAVKNWVLLPYGIADRDEVQDQPQYLNNYYGGSFTAQFDTNTFTQSGLKVGSTLEITLTPQGIMLDGSKGRAFVLRKPIKDGVSNYFYVNNIPIGSYRLAGQLVEGNARSPLHLKEVGPNQGKGFGLDPKEADGSAALLLRPYSAKVEGVTPMHGHWEGIQVDFSR